MCFHVFSFEGGKTGSCRGGMRAFVAIADETTRVKRILCSKKGICRVLEDSDWQGMLGMVEAPPKCILATRSLLARVWNH